MVLTQPNFTRVLFRFELILVRKKADTNHCKAGAARRTLLSRKIFL